MTCKECDGKGFLGEREDIFNAVLCHECYPENLKDLKKLDLSRYNNIWKECPHVLQQSSPYHGNQLTWDSARTINKLIELVLEQNERIVMLENRKVFK